MNEELELENGRSWEQYWDTVRRRRWWLLGPAFVFWVVGLGVSYYLPSKYKSEALILVDQPKVNAQYVTPNVTVDVQNQLQSLTEQILSRTRLFGIIQNLHLYPGDTDPASAVRRMRDDIEITPVKSELSSFKISYSAPKAEVAEQVAERITQFFLDENIRKQQLSEDMTQFLEAQLQEARKDLDFQEENLRQFRSRYLGVLPEQLQTNVQILAGLQDRMASSQEALNRAEQQNMYLRSVLSQTKTSRSPAGALDKELERLKDELSKASSRYTDKHPDVVRLEEEIAKTQQLRESTNNQEATTTKDTDNQPVDTLGADSPTAQLRGQLKSNDLEVASRKKEINNLEHQIGAYQSRLNLTPVREQEMAALMRNYNQSRTNYEALLAKKQQSQMATNLERSQKGEQFRVLDPPSLPQRPYWPNRVKIAMTALIAGLALGVAAVVFKEFTDERIYTNRDLAAFPDVRLLAVLPPILTARDERTRVYRSQVEKALTLSLLIIVPVVTALAWIKP